MSTAISKSEAEALWSSLREAFADVERKIIEVIETKAWLPLGYPTFAAAWNDRMSGFRLSTDILKAHVVYALLSEGQTDEEIAEAILGVGDKYVAEQRKRRDLGLPPDTTRVRSHERALPGQAEKLHVTVTHGEITYWTDLCKALGRDRDQEAADAIRAHFRRLERANRGAA